jgi:hypothetical protein
VKVKVPATAVETAAGFQVPVTGVVLVETEGSTGAGEFWQIGPMGSNEGVTCGLTITVPLAGSDTQPVLVLVIITVYNPATSVVILAIFPGLGTPEGTVQA